jgi:hypothetical protein
MRMSDPILEEIWQARDEHARRFDYDLKRICADLKRIEKQSGRRVVRRKPRRLSTAPTRQVERKRVGGTKES